jgi:hypothetical protein
VSVAASDLLAATENSAKVLNEKRPSLNPFRAKRYLIFRVIAGIRRQAGSVFQNIPSQCVKAILSWRTVCLSNEN